MQMVKFFLNILIVFVLCVPKFVFANEEWNRAILNYAYYPVELERVNIFNSVENARIFAYSVDNPAFLCNNYVIKHLVPHYATTEPTKNDSDYFYPIKEGPCWYFETSGGTHDYYIFYTNAINEGKQIGSHTFLRFYLGGGVNMTLFNDSDIETDTNTPIKEDNAVCHTWGESGEAHPRVRFFMRPDHSISSYACF